MSDTPASVSPAEALEGFADRVAREAQDEAAAVVADLQRVRFRADQVARVLGALGLPLPDEIAVLIGSATYVRRDVTPGDADLATVAPAEDDLPSLPDPPARSVPEPAPAPKRAVEEAETAKEEPPRKETNRGAAGRVTGAQNRQRILEDVQTHGPSTVTEIAERMGFHETAARAHIRALLQSGELRISGHRRSKGDNRKNGRLPGEYAATGVVAPAGVLEVAPRQRPFPGKTPQPVEEQGGSGPEVGPEAAALRRVRDLVVAQPQHVHKVESVARLLGLPAEVVSEALGKLAIQGVLKPRPTGGYNYVKPTDEGAAARLERKRTPQQGSNGGGGPVSGTGKKQVVSHPEVRKIITVVQNQIGADKVKMTPSGHWQCDCPNGSKVLIAGTPSSTRTLLNDRARLRRAGIKGLG